MGDVVMTRLERKIAGSIALLQKAEKLALQYSPDGFHVAFSGGKDSQVIYELCKMGGKIQSSNAGNNGGPA